MSQVQFEPEDFGQKVYTRKEKIKKIRKKKEEIEEEEEEEEEEELDEEIEEHQYQIFTEKYFKEEKDRSVSRVHVKKTKGESRSSFFDKAFVLKRKVMPRKEKKEE